MDSGTDAAVDKILDDMEEARVRRDNEIGKPTMGDRDSNGRKSLAYWRRVLGPGAESGAVNIRRVKV